MIEERAALVQHDRKRRLDHQIKVRPVAPAANELALMLIYKLVPANLVPCDQDLKELALIIFLELVRSPNLVAMNLQQIEVIVFQWLCYRSLGLRSDVLRRGRV